MSTEAYRNWPDASVYATGIPNGAPSMSGLDVSSGTEAGGTTVVASGSNLTGVTGVTINGVACTGVTVIGSTVQFVTPAATFALNSTAANNAKDVALTTPLGTATLTGGYTYTSEFKRIVGASLYVSEYRANDPALVLNAGAVATWPDYAGTNPLTAIGSKQPLFETAGFNGGPSILGDGVDDALNNASFVGLATAKRPYILVAMQRVSGNSSTLSIMRSNTGNNVDTFEYSGGGWQTIRDDDSGTSATNGFGALNTNRNLMEHGFTAGGTAGLVAFGNGLDTTRTGLTDEALTMVGVLGYPGVVASTNTRVAAYLVLGDEPAAGVKTSLRTAFHNAMWIGYTSSSLSLT